METHNTRIDGYHWHGLPNFIIANEFSDKVSINNGNYRFEKDLETYGLINRFGELYFLSDEKYRTDIEDWIKWQDWDKKAEFIGDVNMAKLDLEEINEFNKQLESFNQMLSVKMMIVNGKVEDNPEMKKALADLAMGAITTKENIDCICEEYFGRKLDEHDISSLIFKNELPDKK